MKYLILLMSFISINLLSAEDVSEVAEKYRSLKHEVYKITKDHSSIFTDSSTDEEKKALSKARFKLMNKAIKSSNGSEELWKNFKASQESYREDENSESKKAFMKAKKDLEIHIITEIKANEELSTTYSTWANALKKLENKRLLVLSEMDGQAQKKLKALYKKMQQIR